MALFLTKKQEKYPFGVFFWGFTGVKRLFDEGEFVLAAFDEGKLVNWLIGGDFSAINRDSVAFEELATFALAAGETSFDENVEELGAFGGSREALREQFDFIGAEVGNLAFAEEDCGDFLSRICSGGAVNKFRDFVSEETLAIAGAWVFVVLGDDFVEFFWGNDGVILEVIFERVVRLVEPELIEVEDAGLVAIEPDGVTFGFAEFAAGDLVDDKRAAIRVSLGVFEAANEVNARGAVAILVGTTELQIDIVFAEKMQEIVALNEGVAKLGIADTGAAFADAGLDKLTIEELSHAKCFADFAKEWQEFDFAKPIEVVENLGVGRGVRNADNLGSESNFVFGDFIETFQIAFDGILWVADLAGSTTDEVVRGIAVANKTGAHHEGSKMADVKRIGARVGAPIKITRALV